MVDPLVNYITWRHLDDECSLLHWWTFLSMFVLFSPFLTYLSSELH